MRFVLTPIRVELSKKGDHIFRGSTEKKPKPIKSAIILTGRIKKIISFCNCSYFRIKTVNIMNTIVIIVIIQSLCAKAPTKRSKNIKIIILIL